MATIDVRQLDDGVAERLERRASANDRSLEDEVRYILESAVEDDMTAKRASFLVLSDRLRRSTSGRAHTPAEVLIREDRDRGRCPVAQSAQSRA